MTHSLLRAAVFAATVAATTLAAHGTALAAPAFITIGEQAFALLREVAPQAQVLASREVAVRLPQALGGRTLVAGQETVHAVAVDEDRLAELTLKIHAQLSRCGGFARHASAAEAQAVLQRVAATQTSAALRLASAAAPSYAIDNQAVVNALLPQMQASNILATIEGLAAFQNRRYQSSHGVAASDWLFNAWKQFNPGNRRDLRTYQITHPNWPQKSVVFEMLGSGNSGEVIVIGGHLDSIASGDIETVRAPGADDDASGVASITEVIRVLIANNFRPQRTLRFVAYAAEEVGLLGSQELVALQAAQRTRVVGVLQLDMTAFQGDATDIWLVSDYTNAAQNQFVADLAAAYLPQLTVGYTYCGYACSDHASWTLGGYAASFPFEASTANFNHALHTANDVVATFGGQANHALKFSQLALAFAVELGSDGPPAAR